MAPAAIPVIETERLVVRGPTSADVEPWAAFILDPDFSRYVLSSSANRMPHERVERTSGA